MWTKLADIAEDAWTDAIDMRGVGASSARSCPIWVGYTSNMQADANTGVREARAFAYEDPRPEIQELVPADARRVLDIGCSSGALGTAVKACQSVEVVGIEIDPACAADARIHLDRVLEGDIEDLVESSTLADLGRFDCVILADVLEHLRDPWSALTRVTEMVDADGTVIVSVPNVRHWETFWQLGRHGTWPLRDQGIFDRTHLRWFTLSDACRLVRSAGLEITYIDRQYRHGTRMRSWERYLCRLERTPLEPFAVFQYVMVASPVTGRSYANQ